jgi:hypothetical protein
VRSALMRVIELTRIEFLSNFVSCIGGSRDLSSSKYLNNRINGDGALGNEMQISALFSFLAPPLLHFLM